MHVCDICCWYVNDDRGCEAPRAFKEKACQEASKRKTELDAKEQRKMKTSDDNDSNITERIENYRNVATQCSHCKKKYKAMTTKDVNKVGMWMEYSFCPDCKHKNLISWHVW